MACTADDSALCWACLERQLSLRLGLAVKPGLSQGPVIQFSLSCYAISVVIWSQLMLERVEVKEQKQCIAMFCVIILEN